MSALARWFATRGCRVAGYDRTPTPLTNQLQAEGINIHFEDNPAFIDESYWQDAEKTLVIYTPAIPIDSHELAFFRSKGHTVEKRSRILGAITQNMPSIAVGGTHGKTTTSAMVAHILQTANHPCVAFVGGITLNYSSNLITSEGSVEDENVTAVVEADEFDRSFLQLFPDVAVLTSLDADHLDIYGTAEELKSTYRQFARQVKPGGTLIIQHKLISEMIDLPKNLTVHTYGIGEGDAKALNVKAEEYGFRFDLVTEDLHLPGVLLGMSGYHNVENSVAAACAALSFGISADAIRRGLETFKGVQRRFELHVSGPAGVVVDDYAHHPTEIEAFLRSILSQYPSRHVTACFQPHLYSRTRDFAEGFAKALSMADRVVMVDIYPARENPMPGITSATIGRLIEGTEVLYASIEQLPRLLETVPTDVVLTVGAGDISKVLPELVAQAERRNAEMKEVAHG